MHLLVLMNKTKKIYYRYLIEEDFLLGHLLQEPNRNLIFKEKPSNVGVYIGNVANYNKTKGHITLNLNDNLTIGDTIVFEKEETKYRISELMMGKNNIDYAVNRSACNYWKNER